MKRVFLFLIVFMVVLSSTTLSYPRKKNDLRFFRVSFLNDTFVNTDRSFTHGGKLTLMSNNIEDYRKNPLLKWFSFTNGPGSQHCYSMSIGQNVYTPHNIETVDFLSDDRPYAGYLYFGFGVHSRNEQRQDSFEIDIGIVGRHSFAEETQKIIHDIFKHEKPLGWEHQLKDEFAFQTVFERKIKAYNRRTESGMGIELIPHFGGGLGNVYIFANAGYQVRFGWNLPEDFGVDMHRPGGDTNIGILHKSRKTSIHIFAALDGHAVYRNIFLDGNTVVNSHRVDKYPLTANIMVGLGLWIKKFYITYNYVYWTKKFKTELVNHKFGVMNISYTF